MIAGAATVVTVITMIMVVTVIVRRNSVHSSKKRGKTPLKNSALVSDLKRHTVNQERVAAVFQAKAFRQNQLLAPDLAPVTNLENNVLVRVIPITRVLEIAAVLLRAV